MSNIHYYSAGSNRTIYGFDSGCDTIGLAVSLLGQAYGSYFVIIIRGAYILYTAFSTLNPFLPRGLLLIKIGISFCAHFAPRKIASLFISNHGNGSWHTYTLSS